MDLGLLARVVWRFKFLAAAGFVVAVLLAVLSTASVSFPGGRLTLKYRNPVIYTAQTRILATQSGFPGDGRSCRPQPRVAVPSTKSPGLRRSLALLDPRRRSTRSS